MSKTSDPAKVLSLSIPVWHKMALEGENIPVGIYLNGDSMRPLLRRGKDKVTLIPPNRPLMKGDIVLFARNDGAYVLHRVYRLSGNSVCTLGDACRSPDMWMPADDVWGIAVSAERNGKVIRLDSGFSRIYGRIWMSFRPARAFASGIISAAKRRVKKIIGYERKNG